MNKEYVERETLLKTPPFTKCGGDTSEYTEGYLDCAEEARKAIRNAPTADVVEVRHGKWIDTDTFDSHYTPIYQCSECWKEVADNYISYHKWCLHCGAKMDGGK